MEEKHVKIFAGLFLAALVIYLVSKRPAGTTAVQAITTTVNQALEGAANAATSAAAAVAAAAT